RQPEHPIFSFLPTFAYSAFAKRELAERKISGYPPFAELLLLSFSAKTPETAQRHGSELARRLATFPEIEVIGPYASADAQIRILVKSTNRALLLNLLAFVPKAWKIDFDPENIVS